MRKEENGRELKSLSLSFLASLKTCIKKKDLLRGSTLHTEIRKCGLFEKCPYLGNTIVSMYAKCGALTKAHEVLGELPVRDVVSWSALIAGYVQNGHGKDALDCYDSMRSEGLSPDAIAYSCILKACGITQEVDRGKQIHDEIVCQGLLGKNLVLGTALVDMYAKCGLLTRAREVHDELYVRNVVSWNALIAGYTQKGKGEEALICFDRMRKEGFSPNSITYACVLKACSITRAVDRGKQIHDEVVSQGLLGKDVVLGTALADMYAKCGVLLKAQEVLDKLLLRDTVSWNALIAGYIQRGQAKEALECFWRMRNQGLSPSAITYACILKAYAITEEVEMGKQIHDEIVCQGLLRGDLVLGNALVDMYAKCGMLTKAKEVLEKLPLRNVVTWNALITGYAEQGQGKEALGCFNQMQSEDVTPDIVSWNALIGGYAQQGLIDEALGCFNLMQCNGVSPDAITFICVLNACSHVGYVEEGQVFYQSMRGFYGLTPVMEHYACMIDLFGRAGHFEMAMEVIMTVPTFDHPLVWAALLGACQKWGNKRLGKLAFEYAVLLDKYDVAAYVGMENICVAAAIQEDGE